MNAWLDALSESLSSLGVNKEEWFLYPVDEPRDDDLEFLIEIAKAVKAHDRSINLYANPTPSKNRVEEKIRLFQLKNLVNLWQPHLLLADKDGGEFFRDVGALWWIYSVPTFPAKAASPCTNIGSTFV